MRAKRSRASASAGGLIAASQRLASFLSGVERAGSERMGHDTFLHVPDVR
jgi:hypothetical protein